MGEAYVRFALRHTFHYRVMFGSGFELDAADVVLQEEGQGAFQALVGALVALQAQGLVRKDDAQTQANFVWAVVHGVAMLAIDGSFEHQGADTAAITRYAVDRLRTGIAV